MKTNLLISCGFWRQNARNTASLIVFFFSASIATAQGPAPTSAAAPAPAPATPQAPATAKPTLGPLFYTPADRVALDKARSKGEIIITSDGEEMTVDAGPALPPVTGYVRRSDGKTIVWLGTKPRMVLDKETDQRIVPTVLGEGTPPLLRSSTPDASEPTSALPPRPSAEARGEARGKARRAKHTNTGR